MRQVLSISLSPDEIKKTRLLASERGFKVLSDYIRFLLSQDDGDLISEKEMVKRSKEADRLYKNKKLVRASSLAGRSGA